MRADDLKAAVERAWALEQAGDQGDAHRLLVDAVSVVDRVEDEAQALALAEATGALVRLAAPVEPRSVVQSHLERMRRLISDGDGRAVREAVAAAELEAVEWVHGHDVDDAVLLADVLRDAEHLASRYAGRDEPVGVRRVWAEAKATELLLRGHLSGPSDELAVGFETLALALGSETEPRLRLIRLDALARAADLRADDPGHRRLLRETAAGEARDLDAAWPLRHRLELALLDSGEDHESDWARALSVLGELPEQLDPAFVRQRCAYVEALVHRVEEPSRPVSAEGWWTHAIHGLAASSDPEVRDALWSWISALGSDDAPDPVLSRVLSLADEASTGDADPRTASSRLRLAMRRAHVAGALGDPAGAVALYERADARFPGAADDADTAAQVARARLDRALRLSDIGRRLDAIHSLDALLTRFASAGPELEHLLAQAMYWRGRLARENGDAGAAAAWVERLIGRCAASPDPDVRVWAANGLFSQWQTASTAAEAESARARFAALFPDDPDVRIRRHDAVRRLQQAAHAHEAGRTDDAIRSFDELLAVHAGDADEEIAGTLRLATDNLRILRALGPAPDASEDATAARVRALRERLYAADPLLEQGRLAEAEALLLQVIDQASGSAHPEEALIGLAAADALSGALMEAGQWEAVVKISRRAVVAPAGLDHRGARIRARAHVRLGIALGRLGDVSGALSAYDALETLSAGDTDDEVASSRQTAAYNRAVLLDDAGAVPEAIEAYRHAVRIHGEVVSTPGRRLRQVKALRNLALLLDGSARLDEAAQAHRQILDLALPAPDADLAERARASAFDLARLYDRMGHPQAASDLYGWIGTAGALGFSRPEQAAAAREARAAARRARRGGR